MIRGTCVAQHAIKLKPARVRIYMRAHPENRYKSDIHFIITNTRNNYVTQEIKQFRIMIISHSFD